jgi:hypothetical protein
MLMHLGPSCLDWPFSMELDNMEINTRIRGVLVPGVDPNLGSGSVPLSERVNSPCVSLLGLAFSFLCQSPFLNVSMFLFTISGALAVPCGGSPYLMMW